MERHFDGEVVEEEEQEEKEEALSFFLSRSLSLSTLPRDLYYFFFDIDPGQLYSFTETRVSSFEIHFDSIDDTWLIRAGKRRKGQHDKKQHRAIAPRQHFQFCTHDYPVYYISSTLQIRTYASSENEKQEILVHLPRTPRKRKGKNVYLYATVHAVHARTNE